MSLALLRNKGIPLPPIEEEGDLTAKNIINKIRSFYGKLEGTSSEIHDFAEGYFLELLRDYPQSMCAQHMTDSLKQLVTIMYFEDRVKDKTNNPQDWEGYSYEHLALMFDRSKATIHEAVHQKETAVKQLLTEAMLRGKARSIALDELIKEEKEKLKQEQNKQTTDKQPNEPSNTPGGG